MTTRPLAGPDAAADAMKILYDQILWQGRFTHDESVVEDLLNDLLHLAADDLSPDARAALITQVLSGQPSSTPVADALADVDRIQAAAASGDPYALPADTSYPGYGPNPRAAELELAALRRLADTVRASYITGQPQAVATLAAAAGDALPALCLLGDFIGNTFPGKIGYPAFDRCAIILNLRNALARVA
jgi:hypothetical protein